MYYKELNYLTWLKKPQEIQIVNGRTLTRCIINHIFCFTKFSSIVYLCNFSYKIQLQYRSSSSTEANYTTCTLGSEFTWFAISPSQSSIILIIKLIRLKSCTAIKLDTKKWIILSRNLLRYFFKTYYIYTKLKNKKIYCTPDEFDTAYMLGICDMIHENIL